MMHAAVIVFLLLAVFLSIRTNKLTIAGGITGGVVAMCIYLGAGLTGIGMLGTFFLLGTFATKWGMQTKQKLGYAEENKGRRTASQVLANGGVAAITGLLAYRFTEHKEILVLMMAGSLASATADTLSSELGTLYGKRFINILSFKKDVRGENGVISLEGTMLGIAGSVLIALGYAIGFDPAGTVSIIIAGTIGNLTDSILGAAFERKGYIKNDAVNFLNTLTAALVALGLSYILQ